MYPHHVLCAHQVVEAGGSGVSSAPVSSDAAATKHMPDPPAKDDVMTLLQVLDNVMTLQKVLDDIMALLQVLLGRPI